MNWIVIILVSLLFSAFFSGIEIAFVSSNKVRAELDMKQKNLISSILNVFYRNEEMFISTMLVGNNIALVIYGVGMAMLLEPAISRVWNNPAFVVTMQTLLSTIIILFTGEFIPKTVFRVNPNLSLRFFSLPLYLIYVVLYPVSRFTSMVSKGIMRLFGVKIERQPMENMMSKVELDYFIQQSIEDSPADTGMEKEVKIFQNALDFSNTHVRDCMVPRPEIVAVDIDTVAISELLDLFIKTGISKIVVYRDNIDNVLGYIYASEMFRQSEDWKKSIKPVVFTPETMPADKLMRSLMQQKKSMAVVVDEFGGTAGIVTLEDLVEEIFGDIEDGHDMKNLVARRINEKEFEFSGRMEIEKINEMFDLGFPESDDYMTIAGYILFHYQTLPKQGEKIRIENYEFTIIKLNTTKIELVRMKIEE